MKYLKLFENFNTLENWFGKSVMVDKNNYPKTYYHGVGKLGKFTEFRKDFIGGSSGNYGHFGKGFYFTDNYNKASSFSKYVGGSGEVMEVFLKIENPFYVNEDNIIKIGEKYNLNLPNKEIVAIDIKDLLLQLKSKDKIAFELLSYINEYNDISKGWKKFLDNNIDVYESSLGLDLNNISDWYEYTLKERYGYVSDYVIEELNEIGIEPKFILDYKEDIRLDYLTNLGEYVDEWTNAIKKEGYDGIIQGDGEEIVVFEPNQIKSNKSLSFTKSNNIFESFKSQKELEQFTKSILETYSDEIVKSIDSKFYKMSYNKMPIIELSMFNSIIYNELEMFIKENTELQFHIVDKKEFINYRNGEKAHYVTDKERNQLIQILGDSIFLDGDSIVDNINKSIQIWDGDWDRKEYSYSDEKYQSSYYKLTQDIEKYIMKYYSSLLHELQHAYDNWRSNGNYDNDNDSNNYRVNDKKSEELRNRIVLDKAEQEFINKHYIDYLNLKYEVDARFTQAIKNVEFYDVDWDLTDEYSGNDFLYSMIPFEKVFKDFKRVYHEYKSLTDKERKRVNRKLGQFYHLEKDFILDSNIKEILRNKDNNKSYEQLKKELSK